jgi:hypothetical protein
MPKSPKKNVERQNLAKVKLQNIKCRKIQFWTDKIQQ